MRVGAGSPLAKHLRETLELTFATISFISLTILGFSANLNTNLHVNSKSSCQFIYSLNRNSLVIIIDIFCSQKSCVLGISMYSNVISWKQISEAITVRFSSMWLIKGQAGQQLWLIMYIGLHWQGTEPGRNEHILSKLIYYILCKLDYIKAHFILHPLYWQKAETIWELINIH